MKNQLIAGVDVSKATLDLYLYQHAQHKEFKNTPSGIRQLIKWTKAWGETPWFVIEHTGLYSNILMQILSERQLNYSMVSGLALRRSLGMVRGKSDKIDAKAIASYGYRLTDQLTAYKLPNQRIRTLRTLIKLRARMLKQKSGYQASLKEQKKFMPSDIYQEIVDKQKKLIDVFSKQIEAIDKRCRELIREDQQLNQQYKQVTSIVGVGQQTAQYLIARTNAFKDFKSWRAFACYCGTAPFPYQSGSSIRGRTRVSHLANKKGKTLLTMCAISAIQHNKQIKIYYQRKLDQGKPEMSAINAVRNKLLAVIFAVVKRQSSYVNTCKFAA